MELYFSIDYQNGLTTKIINVIRSCKKSLLIMAFQINDINVIKAINQVADQENRDVRILADSNMNSCLKSKLSNRCRLKLISDKLFHYKMMVIDDNKIVSGSCNLHINTVTGKDLEYIYILSGQRALANYNRQIFQFFESGQTLTTVKYPGMLYSINVNLKQQILAHLDSAKKSILIMHFWLTDKVILDKIIGLAQTTEIDILVDKRSYECDRHQFDVNAVEYLYQNGITTRIIDTKLFHYKIICIDDNLVLTGSQNLYTNAFRNHYEDVQIFNSKELNKKFKTHYRWLIQHIPCYSYKEWMLHQYCKQNDINRDDICIVGSHLLDKLGLRKSNDIDFILTSKKRTELSLPNKNKSCGKYIEIVSKHWHPKLADDQIIKNCNNHTILPGIGFKICTPQILLDKKKVHNREKDKQDVTLLDGHMQNQQCFCGFIWSPAFDYHRDILEDINKNYIVTNYYIYDFGTDRKQFEQLVLDIYKTDDISLDKVRNIKLKSMHQNKLVYFTFYISNPIFRKKANGNLISTKVEQIKSKIRTTIKPKITNYIHDIIIHVADNYKQSIEIESLMSDKVGIEYINLSFLLKSNFLNGRFNRADMLVRKHTIEQYKLGGIDAFNLYLNMQRKRVGLTNDYVRQFKALIKSMDNDGFNPDHPIPITKIGQNRNILQNGSHRLAYSYFKKLVFVPVIRVKPSPYQEYSINWFSRKGFSESELKIIQDELLILEEYLDLIAVNIVH